MWFAKNLIEGLDHTDSSRELSEKICPGSVEKQLRCSWIQGKNTLVCCSDSELVLFQCLFSFTVFAFIVTRALSVAYFNRTFKRCETDCVNCSLRFILTLYGIASLRLRYRFNSDPIRNTSIGDPGSVISFRLKPRIYDKGLVSRFPR